MAFPRTASGFAADIERHLHDEPVEAGPPSAAYRFRKFAKRNKAALLITSVVSAAMILGLAGTTWQSVRATHAERVAKVDRNRALEAEKRAKAESDRASCNAPARLIAERGAFITHQCLPSSVDLSANTH